MTNPANTARKSRLPRRQRHPRRNKTALQSFLWKARRSARPRKACSRGNVERISISHPCVLRLKTTRTTFSFTAHGALRHHSSDRLRQRPSVGGYASQFARTLLRPCFARLLAWLVGEPDGFAVGASCAHPTRSLRDRRIPARVLKPAGGCPP